MGRRSRVWTSHSCSSFGDGFARAALEEHIVGHDDRGPAVDLEQRLDVLHEVELLVTVLRPEVIADDLERLAGLLALGVDDHHA